MIRKNKNELIAMNGALVLENNEKDRQLNALIVSNKEHLFQHEERDNLTLELIAANNELKRAEQQFRLVVESSPSAMILVDKKGFIILINTQTERIFGYERSELVGKKMEILIPDRFRAQHPKRRDTFFKKTIIRPMHADQALFAVKKNGQEIQVEIGLNPIDMALGQMVLASIIDITERKLQEVALKTHNLALLFQIGEKEKREEDLIVAHNELVFQNEEKEKRATELIIINIQKEETEKSKLIIEEKNKSIIDSITYARRIQQAKLPKKEDIYASLPQSFVLFKPKDIVSGDFYFFHRNDDFIFIVAADCTGHGVPGAFMSMIGSEKLDDAVAHSSDTSEILKHLNKGIKQSLHQSDSDQSTRDGMDIALCSIDIKSRRVRYAGANRPLWIVRNGQLVVDEIKPTKRAIGGRTDWEQHFETHELELQPGDTFYISTDGYADQFGGDKGKKLMTKKFKEILLKIQHKSMPDQEKHLEHFIENWREESEQVDDILVIGVRM